jgi:putative DNA primase/helicase
VSAEDDDEDTIRPRVDLLGGDPSRVHSLTHVLAAPPRRGKKGEEEGGCIEQSLDLGLHLNYLDQWLGNNPLVALVVLDPLSAFLGKVDSHRNNEVRALLTPLAKLAAKWRVALLGINHLNKGDLANAVYRAIGSIAFVAAARSSWLVTADPKEKDRRLLTRVKVNVASKDVGGLAFRIGEDHKGISWEEGRVDTSASEALRVPETANRAPAKAEAKDWLRDLLEEGPVDAKEALEKAEADGLCEKTVRAAMKDLGVRKEKKGGAGEGWVWSLPKE